MRSIISAIYILRGLPAESHRLCLLHAHQANMERGSKSKRQAGACGRGKELISQPGDELGKRKEHNCPAPRWFICSWQDARERKEKKKWSERSTWQIPGKVIYSLASTWHRVTAADGESGKRKDNENTREPRNKNRKERALLWLHALYTFHRTANQCSPLPSPSPYQES